MKIIVKDIYGNELAYNGYEHLKDASAGVDELANSPNWLEQRDFLVFLAKSLSEKVLEMSFYFGQ